MSCRIKTHRFRMSYLSLDDFRRCMTGAGWLTATQLTGMLSHLMPPEAKLRMAMCHDCDISDTANAMLVGAKVVIIKRVSDLVKGGYVERSGKCKATKYRWKESEGTSGGEDSLGWTDAIEDRTE